MFVIPLATYNAHPDVLEGMENRDRAISPRPSLSRQLLPAVSFRTLTLSLGTVTPKPTPVMLFFCIEGNQCLPSPSTLT